MIPTIRLQKEIFAFIKTDVEGRVGKELEYIDQITETYHGFKVYIFNEVWVGLGIDKTPDFVKDTIGYILNLETREVDVIREAWEYVVDDLRYDYKYLKEKEMEYESESESESESEEEDED